jgi:hypothetical protein
LGVRLDQIVFLGTHKSKIVYSVIDVSMILQRIKNDDDEQRSVPAGAAPAQGGAGFQVVFFSRQGFVQIILAPNLPTQSRPRFPPNI